MGFSTGLYSAVTGLTNAQANLAVTGQNISNSTVAGYTRQQLIQNTSTSITHSGSNTGSFKNQIGLGSNAAFVRQIRDKFFDISYREQNSIGNYYATKYIAGQEIENILGELQSSYTLQSVFSDVFQAINELINDPSAIETRTSLIQTCVTFLDKVQTVNNSLFEYQMNLNSQIIDQVTTINQIVEQIDNLNRNIASFESDGVTRANDLRDERNNLIDELSSYIGIEVKEIPIADGNSTRIDILANGVPLLSNGSQNKLGVKYMNGDYPFVEPVFTTSTEILPSTADNIKLYPNLATENLSSLSSSTSGSLKSLLVCRGDCIGNFTKTDAEVGNYLISNLQKDLDTLVNTVVKLLNETVAPTDGTDQPYNLNGEQVATQIFVRVTDLDYMTPEDVNDLNTLYTINNIRINPELLKSDGYNLLALSASGAESDTTIIEKLISDWKGSLDSLGGYNIDGFYNKITSELAIEINDAEENYKTQVTMVNSIENKRLSVSGVSLDEELADMMRFQYAYSAAAKVITVIDDMIERVVSI